MASTSGNQSTRTPRRQNWTVTIIDANGNSSERQMRVQDIFRLPSGSRILVPFKDRQTVTLAAGLLGQWLGSLARDYHMFPLSYESWPVVPRSYKEAAWRHTILVHLAFEEGKEEIARVYIMQDIGKKWRDGRCRLWAKHYDPRKSKEENIESSPPGVQREQWAGFLEYRLRAKTKEIMATNTRNQDKMIVNHTGGSKKINLRRAEMVAEQGREVSRGEMFIATHTRADGTYRNEATRLVCEKIAAAERERPSSSVADNDALGMVLGKEHSGRVRGMGFGVSPSQVFTGSLSRTDTARSRPLDHDADDNTIRVDRDEYSELKSTVVESKKCIGILFNMVNKFCGDRVDVPGEVTAFLSHQDSLSMPPPPPGYVPEFVPSTQDRTVGSDEETDDGSY